MNRKNFVGHISHDYPGEKSQFLSIRVFGELKPFGFGTGNRRLPLDERHSVPAIGKITINQVEKSDEDVYKCVVLSLSGERREQTFHLRVSGRSDPSIGLQLNTLLEEFERKIKRKYI